VGRTIPSWRIVVEEETTRLSKFKQFLRPQDRTIFGDLLTQCKLYAAEAGLLASPVKEVPLLLSMIFAQHKKLTELEKRLNETLRVARPGGETRADNDAERTTIRRSQETQTVAVCHEGSKLTGRVEHEGLRYPHVYGEITMNGASKLNVRVGQGT